MATESIRVFEVGPRDGLQNEPKSLSLKDKFWFVSSLVAVGVRDFELGSFVRTDLVPQMSDTDQLFSLIQKSKVHFKSTSAWCLVPNQRGLQRALNAGVTNIAVFTAATESFTKRNIGMTIRESMMEFRQVIEQARAVLGKRLKVRGYISTAFGCPFEGKVPAGKALLTIEKLASLGLDQISIGDTIGVATPKDIERVLKPALKMFGSKMTAIHLHDTRGTALANALRAIDLGTRIIDSSAGGLGGCPFAPGASGNLATEDLVYMLNGMGMKTGINLEQLCRVSLELSRRMKRPLTSRYLQTYVSQCKL